MDCEKWKLHTRMEPGALSIGTHAMQFSRISLHAVALRLVLPEMNKVVKPVH